MRLAVVRLDHVCDVIMGQAPSGAAYNAEQRGWPLIAGAGDFGDIYPEPAKFTTAASKLSKPGDIILGIRATIGEKVLSNGEYCLGRGVAALRPGNELDARYLWHWLGRAQDQLASKAKGATFKQVNREDIGELKISLPPLTEQRRIAAILDQADALRAKRRAALAQLDTLAQSIFSEVIGATERRGWPQLKVEELGAPRPSAIRTGPFGSQLLHSEFVEAGIPVLGIDNVVQNEFVWARPRFITERKYRDLGRYTIYPGDVLITIMGTCGRCAIVPDDVGVAINTKHLCCITLDQTKCLPDYLRACFLRHPHVLYQLGVRERGAVMPGLNMQIIKELRIPLPPLAVQHDFVRQQKAVDAVKASKNLSLTHLDALFASLQHRAFRGEL